METVNTLQGGWAQHAALLLGSIYLSYYIRNNAKNGRSGLKLPPSPKGLPILGNILDMPLRNCQQGYSKWAKELNSDIISASAVGTNFVVVDSVAVALELMDKRSSRYSSRMGWDYLFAMLPYGEEWRERRRMFVQHFRPADTSIIRPRQHEFVGRLLVELSRKPDQFFEVLRWSVGGFIMSLAYGIPVKAHGDPHLEFSELSVRTVLEETTPGSNFVDVLPLLKYIPSWFPGAGFRRRAKELYYMSEKFRTAPFDQAVSSFGTPLARSSFVSVALGAVDETSVDAEKQKQIIKDTAAMFYGAGTDTIVASILSWIWYMMKNPHIQARVHDELDKVLNGRLPDFEERDNLPYLMATLMESMRLAPPAPLGIPHKCTEDDVYGDYFIPKDSLVVSNIWSMLRREDEYGLDASSYNPNRFLTSDGKINANVMDPHIAAFGFGRRACPGAHIGQSMAWLAAASLATVFEFSEPLGEDGVPIDQPEDYDTALL
ncbi:hypothetical protein MD484_g610, partial [Candolleomyces efflorescens]